ncbi:hydroxyisourate hydrolase [Pokkaliibacter plantistimulans]|uniref:5-hydroxyisourate hydrolase n=2 Tax=Pseudomonadota TaxID=1224 RepID=A0A2S5KW60_9PROT|nr:hydroxyisourate hydrolase [Pokkaliibacter plantistimulans]
MVTHGLAGGGTGMISLSTHALDTLSGRPMQGLQVVLERFDGESWWEMSAAATNEDGRIREWPELEVSGLTAGRYRLTFDLQAWCQQHDRPVFFPEATLTFELDSSLPHYHIPLLFAGYGFSTYRGS